MVQPEILLHQFNLKLKSNIFMDKKKIKFLPRYYSNVGNYMYNRLNAEIFFFFNVFY